MRAKNLEERRKLEQSIIKFICEFIIDAAEQEQDVDPDFCLNSIIHELIQTDESLKPVALQFVNDFKNNLPKLLDIPIKNISM